MTYDEMIAVITARKEGKPIERQSVIAVHADKWIPFEGSAFDFCIYKYRVKQTSKYRPYATNEECFADIIKHGGWMKTPDGGFKFLQEASKDIKYNILCDAYVWADDGSPCGVKEE